jgi:hypothetical protein
LTKKIALAMLAFCVSLPASAETNNDPIRWGWTCKSSGYYSIKAFPNGGYKPEVDFTGNPQVVINIRAASKDTSEFCRSPGWKDFYYAEMQGADLATLYNGLDGPFCNEAKPSFENSTLNKVAGSTRREMSFIVSRDDNNWRFVISGTDLTTEREGRELRIVMPKPGVSYDAKAGVWMVTGQCVMTINQGR